MSVYIYNSLTRKKEEFVPLDPPRVNIYSCGVTVYDDCHIGHARSLYIFEVIRRYLKYRGFDVKFVRNITDIDDKIINRATELKISWDELVKKYISRYYEDLKAMGIPSADLEPRATENITGIKDYIQGLIDKGFAYPTQTGVYFSVKKFRDYGKLSGQGTEQMLTGVRKEVDETKEDPLDFALWKRSKPGEPAWPSPWQEGRPGWHIECSLMSTKYLGVQTLDIHAGGRDLIFPHHENEIAQSEALSGKQFAKYWIHHGLLTINGQKMSKSLGNFITIKDFIEKYSHPELLKLFFLSTHYSHPADYNEERISEARQSLTRIKILLDKADSVVSGQDAKDTGSDKVAHLRERFIKAMDDDFNTPQGLAVLFDLVTETNKNMDDPGFVASARGLFVQIFDIFCLSLDTPAGIEDESGIEDMIAKRAEAKKKKDFKEADRIRKELESKGIILEDSKDGTTWRRKL